MKNFIPIFLLLSTGGAEAAPLSLTSGEHGSFTRVYLPFDENLNPEMVELQVSNGGYRLSVAGLGRIDQYNTSDFWGRISKERVSSLEVGENYFTFSVDCECHLRYHLNGSLGLVVDVVDGPFPDGSVLRNFSIFDAQEETRNSHSEKIVDRTSNVDEKGPVYRDFLSLINWDMDYVEEGGGVISSYTESASKLRAEIDYDPGAPSLVADSVSFPSALNPAECPDEKAIRPERWTAGGGYAVERFKINSSLVDQDEAYVFDMAAFYLKFGFFAEAQSFLSSVDLKESSDLSSIYAISTLLHDDGRGAIPESWRDCGDAARMWHLISSGRHGEYSENEIRLMLQEFLKLPEPIRRQTSERWENSIEKLDVFSSHPSADLSRSYNSHLESRNEDPALHSSHRVLTDDFLEDFERALQAESSVPESYFDLSLSLLFEEESEKVKSSISRLRMRAALKNRDFHLSGEILDQENLGDYRAALLDDYYFTLSQQADDDLFLSEAFSTDGLALTDKTTAALKERMEELGFQQVSVSAVVPPLSGSHNHEEQSPRSEVVVTEDQFGTLAQAQIEMLNAADLISEVSSLLRN